MSKKSTGNGFKPVKRSNGRDGRFLVLSRFITDSPEYKRLSPIAKAVMLIMQKQHWTNKYTVIGRTQIADELGRDVKSVTRAWNELINNCWLRIEKYHDHNKKEVRTWELTWMSYHGKAPKDTWIDKG